ncbi:hypothetical protein N8Z47_00195 [Salibacteraceae bacterium]|nr:hypothetical protein [Salibacteraceae bacterium]
MKKSWIHFLVLFHFITGSALAQYEVAVDSNDSDTLRIISSIDSVADEAIGLDSSRYFSRELSFAYYLISNEQYLDARLLLNKLEAESKVAKQSQRDSINYLSGWVYYFSRDFNEAINLFSNVSVLTDIGIQSQFYKSICFVYMEEYDSARSILSNLDVDSSEILNELRVLQLTAISLLERDYESYDSLSVYLTGKHFQFSQEEKSMVSYHKNLTEYKQKSPWIAGGLSALFPGLGKFYAGYIGLPFGTISMTLPLAAVAIEAALIAGVLSPPFLVLGSIFGIFYIGNIWGSVLSVYTIKKEIYDEIDSNITYDMHIPLRRVFW